MTPGYAALLRADIALVLFRRGEDARALRIAAEGARMGSPAAAFAAGLAAWGTGGFDIALPFFERRPVVGGRAGASLRRRVLDRARRHPRAPAGALHAVDDAGGAGIAHLLRAGRPPLARPARELRLGRRAGRRCRPRAGGGDGRRLARAGAAADRPAGAGGSGAAAPLVASAQPSGAGPRHAGRGDARGPRRPVLPARRRVAIGGRAPARLRTLSPAALAAAGRLPGRPVAALRHRVAGKPVRRRRCVVRRRARPDADVADDRQPRHGRPLLARAGGGAALERAGPLPRPRAALCPPPRADGWRRGQPHPAARRLQRGPWQSAEVAAGAWPSRRPVPVHRGHPARRDPRLPAPGAGLFLDLRLPPRPAVAQPRPDRRRRVPALRRAGGGHGHAASGSQSCARRCRAPPRPGR